MKNYQVFTHKDLDGAASLLTLLWSKPDATVTYREITNYDIGVMKEYVKKTCNPPHILIMDLALREDFLPELDYEYITFIDHHKRSEEHIEKFKQAKIIHKETTSNTILVRKLFKDKAPEFTEAQKKLIMLADDYDSNDIKFKESYDFNILFWTYFKNEFCYFVNYYKNGFRPFSEDQKKIIAKAKYDAKKLFEETACYQGEVIIEGFPQKVIAAMTDSFNSIVIDILLTKYNPDILFYINPKTNRVSMRQKKRENPINLSQFAEKYCNGNGHNFTAGGEITPLFMELTKKLKQL
jgi:oligoribonuclease NrnB/cAMP/cGMP phosphodiesterase (DHH superfamily)